jgi:hypothetical protein
MLEYKEYRKKGTQSLAPWSPDTNMTFISVSVADRENGSPKLGDMIAINKSSPNDMWLVAEKFFIDHYEPV